MSEQTNRPQLVSADPVLASLNFAETVSFYERLGFRVLTHTESYLMVHRDNVTLHFWACSDANIAQNTSCYVYVQGVDALYEEMRGHDVIHPNGALQQQPYGLREFTMLDVHGNAIRFGEHTV